MTKLIRIATLSLLIFGMMISSSYAENVTQKLEMVWVHTEESEMMRWQTADGSHGMFPLADVIHITWQYLIELNLDKLSIKTTTGNISLYADHNKIRFKTSNEYSMLPTGMLSVSFYNLGHIDFPELTDEEWNNVDVINDPESFTGIRSTINTITKIMDTQQYATNIRRTLYEEIPQYPDPYYPMQ